MGTGRSIRRAGGRSWFAAACVASLPLLAFADDQPTFVEEVLIVGEREPSQQIPGSAHYINLEQIEKLGHTDIQRIVRQVPGVSVQVEDGYGLRPNISIRGVATERSGRITLLEDNVLIAPAPYSAPSAYYFPTIGRMSAIEVLKGPAAITQGPYTIGGALNMVSTPVPETMRGRVVAEVGQDSTYRLHAHYGGRTDNGFGFLVETHQWQSDGFHDIDRGGDSGLDVDDYTVKLSYAPEDSPHSLELKIQKAEQQSEQSYLGLTDVDFDRDPFRRYGMSALDNIATDHDQVILRYQYDLSESLSVSATYYNNEHERNWFKTEGMDFDGSANAQEFSRTSWSSIVSAINSNLALGGYSAAELQGILDGTLDTLPGSIQLRSNAREYFSRGYQVDLDWTIEAGAVTHDLTVGVRLHEDEEERLQRNSAYSQVAGALVLDDLGLLGNAGNRIQEAEAFSIHVHDRISVGKWTFAPGVRYEDIDQGRTRFETRVGRTSDPALRAASNFRDSRDNNTKVFLPGLGVIYDLNDTASIFGGVHKGFTAPSNAPDVDEEEALNYELGVRFGGANLHGEVAYFMSDYKNLLGECTSSSGSDCEIGDAFNGDAATVQGLELVVRTNLNPNGSITVPLEFAYSYIDGEFDTDIADTDFFGDVSKGDPIPYIPETQFNLTLGLQAENWGFNLAANYVDEVCVRASCGVFEKTDATMILDMAGSYRLTNSIELFGRIENLAGAEDVLGRHPYGARPNKDTTASVGVRVAL